MPETAATTPPPKCGAIRRQTLIEAISKEVEQRGLGIAAEIKIRNLYFRVSVIGSCNLSCPFCHNEGGPDKGLAQKETIKTALAAAYAVGFRRVQYTGGEPLIRPDISFFIKEARTLFHDVGITTNGTYLPRRIDQLIDGGITRIHISLQEESLEGTGSPCSQWSVPNWLRPALDHATEAGIVVRLNLPVSPHSINKAAAFLASPACSGLNIQLFTILPSNFAVKNDADGDLKLIASNENLRRAATNNHTRISVRDYKAPSGLRCRTCTHFSDCREQSRSLRFGVDGALRPCLATRLWDSTLTESNAQEDLMKATLLAIDYDWPEVTLDDRGHYQDDVRGG